MQQVGQRVVAAASLVLVVGLTACGGAGAGTGTTVVVGAEPAQVTVVVPVAPVGTTAAPSTMVPSGDPELDAMDAELAAAEEELASLEEAAEAAGEGED